MELIKKPRKTLFPLLLSALLLRYAQLPEVDAQVISMGLESDPRVTNAARTIGSCKASMRRLQYNKITSHLTSDNQSERFAISSTNVGDNDDLDHEPKELTGISSGKAATRGNRRQRRRRGTKRKYAEDDSTQEERDHQILTLITTKVTETETEPQPFNKLLQILNDDKKLPVYVIDENMQPYPSHVCTEIFNRKNLPLLLGNRSLIKTKSTIEFEDRTLTIDWKNKKLCLPINLESSEHFHLQFHPMP